VVPVVSLVGRSGSGKTTLLERLIPALAARGYRVGTIKHHFHGPVTVDVPGKDSWRHRQAGARAVALLSPETFFTVRNLAAPLSLDEIAHTALAGMDIVLTEGFKSAAMPKIEVSRAALGGPLLTGPADGLVGVAADWATGAPVPHFALDAVSPLTDFLERTFLHGDRPRVEVLVDGRRVAVPPEAAEALARAVRSLVDGGSDAAGEPTIEIRLRGPAA
jgi:molybdopterin-guanine dinucleotide biosynthesis adapter protein